MKEKSEELARSRLNDFAKALLSSQDTALPQMVTKRSDVEVSRSGREISPEFAQNVFAMAKEEGKAFTVGMNDNKMVLAVLKKIGQSKEADEKAYENFIASQLVQIKGSDATQMLYKGARELQNIEYNDDAIKMVIQQDSSDK